jgi:hypothetical protein
MEKLLSCYNDIHIKINIRRVIGSGGLFILSFNLF